MIIFPRIFEYFKLFNGFIRSNHCHHHQFILYYSLDQILIDEKIFKKSIDQLKCQ